MPRNPKQNINHYIHINKKGKPFLSISNSQFPISKNDLKTTAFSQKFANFKSKKGRRANAPKTQVPKV